MQQKPRADYDDYVCICKIPFCWAKHAGPWQGVPDITIVILPATRAQQHPNWIHHPDLFKHVRITQANTRYQIPTGEFKEVYIPIHFQYANNGKMMIPSHPFFHPPACPSTIGLAMIDMAQRCCATGWKLEGFSSYSWETRDPVPGRFRDQDTTKRNHRLGCNANIVFSACKKAILYQV